MIKLKIMILMIVMRLTNKLHVLWSPVIQCNIHKGSPIIPILNRNNPVSHTDTHFFNIHSNIDIPSRPSHF